MTDFMDDMLKAKLLKDIRVDGSPIDDWTQEPLEDGDMSHLLLYKPRDYEHGGFDAVVLEWKYSDDSGNRYSIAIEMIAYFDGVRHINFWPEDDGYSNYPPIALLPKIFTRVRELEMRYCLESEL